VGPGPLVRGFGECGGPRLGATCCLVSGHFGKYCVWCFALVRVCHLQIISARQLAWLNPSSRRYITLVHRFTHWLFFLIYYNYKPLRVSHPSFHYLFHLFLSIFCLFQINPYSTTMVASADNVHPGHNGADSNDTTALTSSTLPGPDHDWSVSLKNKVIASKFHKLRTSKNACTWTLMLCK
jgi:hypothetical protein